MRVPGGLIYTANTNNNGLAACFVPFNEFEDKEELPTVDDKELFGNLYGGSTDK